MSRLIKGHSDSTSLGTYKEVIEKEANKLMSKMQPILEQHRVLKKSKRFRSAFTTEQTNYLEEHFKKFQYINKEQRQKVASILKISDRSIKIWFQNRRMKEKKENHKEYDDDICGETQTFGKDQLNNVPALPLTNEPFSYSLPMLSFTADTTTCANTNNRKPNTVEKNVEPTAKSESLNSTKPSIKRKASSAMKFYKEVNSQEYPSPYFHQQQIIDTNVQFAKDEKHKKSASQEYKSTTSAEFSINLCKKYKQKCTSTDAVVSENIANEDKMMKNEPKQALKTETSRFNIPENIPSSKKCKVSYPLPPKLPTQMNLGNSMYYPVMPCVYSPPMTSAPPPYMRPDCVLWKPVNFMSVMATNTMDNIAHRAPPPHEQSKNCIFNCHGSQHIPITLPRSLHNPYAQYVITVPFPHTSPGF